MFFLAEPVKPEVLWPGLGAATTFPISRPKMKVATSRTRPIELRRDPMMPIHRGVGVTTANIPAKAREQGVEATACDTNTTEQPPGIEVYIYICKRSYS
jgi:hypothetical protein